MDDKFLARSWQGSPMGPVQSRIW